MEQAKLTLDNKGTNALNSHTKPNVEVKKNIFLYRYFFNVLLDQAFKVKKVQ